MSKPSKVRSVEEEAEIIYQRLKAEEEPAETRQAAAERIARERIEQERSAREKTARWQERTVLTIKGVEYAFRWCSAEGGDMGFRMLETLVTQKMWESVMGSNPSKSNGMQLPVDSVSWNNCQEFIVKLNYLLQNGTVRHQMTGFKISLPTAIQWECMCTVGAAGGFDVSNTMWEWSLDKYYPPLWAVLIPVCLPSAIISMIGQRVTCGARDGTCYRDDLDKLAWNRDVGFRIALVSE